MLTRWMRTWVVVGLVSGVGAMLGCEGNAPLTRPQAVDRANLPLRDLPAEAPKTEATASSPGMPGETGMAIAPPTEEITGTYTFVTPDTVTRVKRSTESFEQYSLYYGQPGPKDVPFVVITVAKDTPVEAERPGGGWQVKNTRSYLLNGMIAREWTGYTDKNYPFCELVVTHEEKGDKLHAVAIARTEAQRKLALEVLGSVTWKADRP